MQRACFGSILKKIVEYIISRFEIFKILCIQFFWIFILIIRWETNEKCVGWIRFTNLFVILNYDDFFNVILCMYIIIFWKKVGFCFILSKYLKYSNFCCNLEYRIWYFPILFHWNDQIWRIFYDYLRVFNIYRWTWERKIVDRSNANGVFRIWEGTKRRCRGFDRRRESDQLKRMMTQYGQPQSVWTYTAKHH